MSVTVAESVVVVVTGPPTRTISVNDAASVAESITRASVLYVTLQSTVKLWSRLDSVDDVTSPDEGTGGVEIGSPTYPTSKFNGGVLSDVDNEGCTFPTSANDINLDKGTIEFWAKLNFDPDHGSAHYLFDFYNGVAGGIRLYFEPLQDDFRVRVSSGGTTQETITTEGLSWVSGDLLHFAVVWDRTGNDIGASKTLVLYINGVEEASSTTTWNTDTVISNMRVGISRTDGSHSDAVIDNLKTYNTCKTDFTDRESLGAGGAGDSILVVDYPILSQALVSRQISVFDTISLAELVDVLRAAEYAISVNDAVSLAEAVGVVIGAMTVSVNDSAAVAESISRALADLGISVNDTVTLAELVTLTGLIFEISVSDAITVAEYIARSMGFEISVFDAIQVLERYRAMYGWPEPSVTVTVWADISPDTTTWTDVTRPDDWNT